MKLLGFLVLVGCAVLAVRPTRADSVPASVAPAASAPPAVLPGPSARTHALLIGDNRGGPGQAPLRYAEADTLRVGDVLTTLAGYDARHVQRLIAPSAGQLRAALDTLGTQLAASAQAGEPTVLFLNYSGHARADALSLGDEVLPLAELRERLLALPATLLIVVLDACQSGAFSRVKGASAAGDFSYNSVQRWNTEGVAVMASSSAVELSQESDELKSSYFTHHLLVGLRGAGDGDRDGRVTLAEAYAYAYNHTLAGTAATSVGGQHVTLETDLRGKGEVPITYPAQARSGLRLPAALEGMILLQRLPSWSVLAELHKVKGEPIDLAVAEGDYAATVRQPSGVQRCTLKLADGRHTTLDMSSGCQPVEDRSTRAKGSVDADRAADEGDEGWGLEILGGFGGADVHDEYDARLRDFGFVRGSSTIGRYTFTANRRLLDHLVVGVTYFNLDATDYTRDNDGTSQTFEYSSRALGGFVQGDLSLGHHRRFVPFVRAGAGAVFGSSTYDEIVVLEPFADSDPAFQDVSSDTRNAEDSFTDYYLGASVGAQVMPLDYLGLQLELRYVLAPALQALTGETRDVGGYAMLIGLRLRTWE